MKIRVWDSERAAGTASDSESFGATAPQSIPVRKILHVMKLIGLISINDYIASPFSSTTKN